MTVALVILRRSYFRAEPPEILPKGFQRDIIYYSRVSERHSGFAKFDETPIFVFYIKNKDKMIY